MSMLEKLVMGLALALGPSVAGAADAPRFGQPIAPSDLAPWDISIGPDGRGLPLGSGTPSQGAAVYAAHGCAACHGEKGSGGPSGPLVGGGPLNTTDRDPVKLIGNYWPFATTIFDYTRRAMALQQPKTLNNVAVKAFTALNISVNQLN